MYAVIFTAVLAERDDQYRAVAKKMRAKAFEEYGCIDFISVCEGQQEISISYWPSMENIRLWKKDAEHLSAQQYGVRKWYQSYSVKIVKIEREYQKGRELHD